jgi:hypothetical protein
MTQRFFERQSHESRSEKHELDERPARRGERNRRETCRAGEHANLVGP